MKKIVLLLLLTQFCFGQSQVYELPRTSTLGDSISVLLLEIYNAASDSFKTRGITFADFKTIMGDSLKRDSLFSEISFTAAFNARLDSFLIAGGYTEKLQIDTLLVSNINPDSTTGTYYYADPDAIWNSPLYRYTFPNGRALVDSSLWIGQFDGLTLYNHRRAKFFVSDTVRQFGYYVTYPTGGPYFFNQTRLATLNYAISPKSDEPKDYGIQGGATALYVSVDIDTASADTVRSISVIQANAINNNPYLTQEFYGLNFATYNYEHVTNMKGGIFFSSNSDTVDTFMYGNEIHTYNSPQPYNGDSTAYAPSVAGIRTKVENKARNLGQDYHGAYIGNAYGNYMWIYNHTDGDSAVIDNAYGYYIKTINSGAKAKINNSWSMYVDSPGQSNNAIYSNHYGLYLADQTLSNPVPAGENWAIYAEGPKSYIEDLRTDTLTVSDSISTNKLHITDIASYASDRDITDLYHLTDKRYVDEAVTALGARYYMLDDASGEADYKSCSTTVSTGGEQSVSEEDLANDDYVQGWIAPNVNEPDKLLLGVYNWRIYAEKTGGTKTLRLYWKLVERKNDDSEVVIATSVVSNEVISGKNSYIIPLNLASDYDIASDSYVVGKIYADVSGGGSAPDITLYYEGSSHSHWQIPVNTEILDNLYVKKAGDTMTGTLNLPVDGLVAGTDQLVLVDDKVGVGKTDPDSTLDVGGSGHFLTNLKVDGQLNMGGNVNLNGNYLSGDGDDEGITIDASGVSTVHNNLNLNGNMYMTGNSYSSSGKSSKALYFGMNTTTSEGFFQSFDFGASALLPIVFSGSKIEFRGLNSIEFDSPSGTERLVINSGGDIGLGGNITASSLAGALLVARGGSGNVGISTTTPDSGRVVIGSDNPWALVLGDKSSTPWSAIKVGDASFTTSSDSTKKRNIKRKIAKGDTTILSRLLDMPEADWYWDGAKIKREKFKPEWHYGGEWDSLSVTKQDSIRAAWIARREARIAKLAERKRFGPMAQDVAEALGPEAGDGESINWDRVNSEYRRAVQELIIIVQFSGSKRKLTT